MFEFEENKSKKSNNNEFKVHYSEKGYEEGGHWCSRY